MAVPEAAYDHVTAALQIWINQVAGFEASFIPASDIQAGAKIAVDAYVAYTLAQAKLHQKE